MSMDLRHGGGFTHCTCIITNSSLPLSPQTTSTRLDIESAMERLELEGDSTLSDDDILPQVAEDMGAGELETLHNSGFWWILGRTTLIFVQGWPFLRGCFLFGTWVPGFCN